MTVYTWTCYGRCCHAEAGIAAWHAALAIHTARIQGAAPAPAAGFVRALPEVPARAPAPTRQLELRL